MSRDDVGAWLGGAEEISLDGGDVLSSVGPCDETMVEEELVIDVVIVAITFDREEDDGESLVNNEVVDVGLPLGSTDTIVVGESEDKALGLEDWALLGVEENPPEGGAVTPVDGLTDNTPVGTKDELLLGAFDGEKTFSLHEFSNNMCVPCNTPQLPSSKYPRSFHVGLILKSSSPSHA